MDAYFASLDTGTSANWAGSTNNWFTSSGLTTKYGAIPAFGSVNSFITNNALLDLSLTNYTMQLYQPSARGTMNIMAGGIIKLGDTTSGGTGTLTIGAFSTAATARGSVNVMLGGSLVINGGLLKSYMPGTANNAGVLTVAGVVVQTAGLVDLQSGSTSVGPVGVLDINGGTWTKLGGSATMNFSGSAMNKMGVVRNFGSLILDNQVAGDNIGGITASQNGMILIQNNANQQTSGQIVNVSTNHLGAGIGGTLCLSGDAGPFSSGTSIGSTLVAGGAISDLFGGGTLCVTNGENLEECGVIGWHGTVYCSQNSVIATVVQQFAQDKIFTGGTTFVPDGCIMIVQNAGQWAFAGIQIDNAAHFAPTNGGWGTSFGLTDVTDGDNPNPEGVIAGSVGVPLPVGGLRNRGRLG